MMHAYSELYLSKAKNTLACMLDYAVLDLNFDISIFFDMFIASGIADRFGSGDCSIIAGRSGAELVYEVLLLSGIGMPIDQPSLHEGRSPEYWTGWALAHYQWEIGLPFKTINQYVPIDEIRMMYNPFHEMDIRQFIDEMNRLCIAAKSKERGKTI